MKENWRPKRLALLATDPCSLLFQWLTTASGLGLQA